MELIMGEIKGLLNGIRKIHFTAICGTAMGSVAVVLKEMGYDITGSDEDVYPPMSNLLADKGITIFKGFDRRNIKENIDLFVIGNAMSRGNPEVEEILTKKKYYISLPELVKEAFIRGNESIVISGTHGKSTTTALSAWLFKNSNLSPGFLIGGIPLNFDTGCLKGEGNCFIIEGDEYDTAFFDKRSKFVHYLPDLLVINNIEFDHADIFEDMDDILLSFKRLVNIVPENGFIIANGDDKDVLEVVEKAHSNIETFGFEDNNKWTAANIEYNKDLTGFDVFKNGSFYDRFIIPIPGKYGIRNSLAVIVLADIKKIDSEILKQSLLSYKGLKRRSEVAGTKKGITVIDDFAHHPTAVRETLFGLRKRYNNSRIFAIFEPRTNTTRRNIFQNELSKAFENADYTVIAKINAPQKVEPDKRLSVEKLIRDVNNDGVNGYYIPDTNEIIEFLLKECKSGDIVVFMSNGGFDNIVKRFLDNI